MAGELAFIFNLNSLRNDTSGCEIASKTETHEKQHSDRIDGRKCIFRESFEKRNGPGYDKGGHEGNQDDENAPPRRRSERCGQAITCKKILPEFCARSD